VKIVKFAKVEKSYKDRIIRLSILMIIM